MQGLKRGTVKLYPHDEKWHIQAEKTISVLSSVLGDTAKEIAHVGSTSINGIHAKPIIDIAVAVNNIDDILPFTDELEKCGIIFRGSDRDGQYLFVIGDFDKDTRSHHIHIVRKNSDEWDEYINFRDYLNAHPQKAAEYEALKLTLAEKFPDDRTSYTSGKSELISRLLKEAKGWKERNND